MEIQAAWVSQSSTGTEISLLAEVVQRSQVNEEKKYNSSTSSILFLRDSAVLPVAINAKGNKKKAAK